MKKVLKFLFALSTATFIPLSLVACKQEELDENLNLVYKAETNHAISDLSEIQGEIISVSLEKICYEKYVISKSDKLKFQEDIAKNVVPKEFQEKNLIWFNEETKSGTKCYDFKFKNFTEEDNEDISWIINQVNGKINVQISYFVGIATEAKTFDAKQKINMTYQIKVQESESDKILDEWKKEFEDKNWNDVTPLEVQVEIKEKPNKGKRWADLDSSIRAKVYQILNDKFNNMEKKNISYSLNDVEKSDGLDIDNKLKLKISFNLNDAVGEIEGFCIKFNFI